MRRLMWFSVGFGTACFIRVYFAWHTEILWLLSFAVLAAAISGFFGLRIPSLRTGCFFMVGASAALIWLGVIQGLYLAPLQKLDGQTVSLTVTASGFSEDSTYNSYVDGNTFFEGKNYHIRIYLKEDTDVSPGDEIAGDFRIRLTAPNGKNESTYYEGNGIFLIANQKGDIQLYHRNSVPLKYYPRVISKSIRGILEASFPDDTRGFAKALLLGDTSGFDYETDTFLKVSGIRHIAAVSGLHVAILYSLILHIFGKRRLLTPLIAVPVLFFFAAVAGFTPSVSRACIMTGLMALAIPLNREYDSPTGLSAACLVMLILNPLSIVSVSFQLSVASVSGILLFSNSIRKKILASFPQLSSGTAAWTVLRWSAGSVSVTVGAMVFTTPISAYYFGMISLIGILTNLLTLWCITFIFYGVAAVCTVGMISSAAASILAGVVSWPIRFVLLVSRVFSRFPLAAVYTQSSAIVLWLVFCYVLLIAFFLFGRRYSGIYLLAGTLCLAAAIAFSWCMPKRDSFRMTAIDVGQGQSILIQSKGRAILVDCGGSNDETAADAIAQVLLSQGIFWLNGIVLTHYDRDHAGALPYLLTRIETEQFYVPAANRDSGLLDQIRKLSSGEINLITNRSYCAIGDGIFTFYPSDSIKNTNESSMCVLFDSPVCAILITGDRSETGELELIRNNTLPMIDILVAGHHGAGTSTSERLLRTLQPEIVVISVGENVYGHPAETLLDRLAECGCTVYRTDLQGNILIRR